MTGLLVLWAALAIGYTATVLWGLRRRAVPTPEGLPSVLLLRPVDAPSAEEVANLNAPIGYGGPLEQVVLSPYRPRLEDGVRWLYSDPTAKNRKVGHLLHGLESLPREGRVVLSVDADVKVSAALVEGLARAVTEGAELAAAPPVIAQGAGLGSRLFGALLSHTHLSFRAQGAEPSRSPAICGKAIALGPGAQKELAELSAFVGEDLELAERVSRGGGKVVSIEEPAAIHDGRRTAARALERGVRWLQVARAHRPLLFFFVPLFLAPTLPLILAALVVRDPAVSAAVLTLIIARTVLSVRLGGLLRSGGGSGEWLLGEALLLAAFAGALWSPRRITWRDRVLVLGRGGRIDSVLSAFALLDERGGGR